MKKILKEWFPNKEEFIELENLAKQQKKDIGLEYTPQVHEKIKKSLNALKTTYGGKSQVIESKDGMKFAAFEIFVPIEHSEYDKGKYDGSVVTVVLVTNPKSILNRPEKFFVIGFTRITLSPQEAKQKYNSIFFEKEEQKMNLAEAKLRNTIRESIESEIFQTPKEQVVKEQGSENEFTANVEVNFDKEFLQKYGIASQGMIDIELVDKKVPLKWKIDYEYRSWGLKTLFPIVPDQKIHLTFETDDGNQIEKDIELLNIETKIVANDVSESSIQLFPYEIEFYRGRNPVVYFTL